MLLEKYNPIWIKQFELLKLEILKGLDTDEYQIEHIGSTAVPELAAKPIIDIDIIFKNQMQFEKIKLALIKLGYYHNGNQGIVDREVFKRTGKVKNQILDEIPHHLYVCLMGSKGLERHLLFRDYLRENRRAQLEYEAIKYKLAAKANQNKKVYATLKEQNANAFIDSSIDLQKLKNR